jgi:anti-sigma28 factor (negative regulator of flagellin synthesis)
MKIHDANLAGPASSRVGGSEAVRDNSRSNGASSRSGVGSDQVELSSLANAVQLANLPDRAAKLEQLALEVETGRYRADSLAISSKIVDEALLEGDLS